MLLRANPIARITSDFKIDVMNLNVQFLLVYNHRHDHYSKYLSQEVIYENENAK